VVICLERDADLHMAQLMPLPLTVSCFSKIQISFTFLVPAHPGSPGKGAVCVTVVTDRQTDHATSVAVAYLCTACTRCGLETCSHIDTKTHTYHPHWAPSTNTNPPFDLLTLGSTQAYSMRRTISLPTFIC